jgi:hypothetical protein
VRDEDAEPPNSRLTGPFRPDQLRPDPLAGRSLLGAPALARGLSNEIVLGRGVVEVAASLAAAPAGSAAVDGASPVA